MVVVLYSPDERLDIVGGELPLADLSERAAKGDAGAQYLLGYRLRRGHGIAKDVNEAVRLFQRAADQGHAPAMRDSVTVTVPALA